MTSLQNNYRGRLLKLYIVNTAKSFKYPWSILKVFVQKNTLKKIKFYNKNVPLNLIKHANLNQMEKKYGGKAENIEENFWFKKNLIQRFSLQFIIDFYY